MQENCNSCTQWKSLWLKYYLLTQSTKIKLSQILIQNFWKQINNNIPIYNIKKFLNVVLFQIWIYQIMIFLISYAKDINNYKLAIN